MRGNLPYEVQRFTGAHELGHIVLHPGLSLHRDRPLLGDAPVLDRREREANYFAACFLAPEKLLRRAFKQRFGTEMLHLDDRVAFAIAGNGSQDLLRSKTGSLEFPRAVATARKFGLGNHFKSLAEEFGLSPTAMAIRIPRARPGQLLMACGLTTRRPFGFTRCLKPNRHAMGTTA